MGKIVPVRKSFRSKIYSHISTVDSHIDNVKNSLERLVFSNEKELERALFKKRLKVVLFVTVLLFILGYFLSPKGQAEVATFYPTACLGGWVNPNNAEGEIDVKSNENESEFTKENSAILPKSTSADIYCGNFVGEILENTKPVKILVALSWSKGEDLLLEENITGSSFASSSKEILDIASTTEVSFTLSTSTVETSTTSESTEETTSTTTESLVEQVLGAVGDTLQKIFGVETGTSSNQSQESTPTENNSGSPTDEASSQNENTTTDTEVPAPPQSSQEAPQETTPPEPAPQEDPVSEPTPTSFFRNNLRVFSGHFIKRTFAEEISTSSPKTVNEDTIQEISIPVTTETTTENMSATSEGQTNESVQQEEATRTSTSTSELSEVASSTEATTTTSFVDTALDVVIDRSSDDQSPNNFLEVLYTFDGVTWHSLGKVNESSMKYRTFEIPVTATTSWSDLGQLQIKIQTIERIDVTPAVYLDGIKIDVLYETPVLHPHPDFARDIILKDKSDDGVRVVNIINSDTNNNEIWYTTVGEQGGYGVEPGSWVQVTLDQSHYSHKLIDIYGQNVFWADDVGKLLWVSNLEKGTNDGIALVEGGSTTVTFTKSNGEEWIFEYNHQTKVGVIRIKN